MENLRKIRKARGMTQKQLAELVGVTESSISQYENGGKTPSFEIALKLAEALDCESADLVSKRDVIIEKTATQSGDGYDEKLLRAMQIFRSLDDTEKDMMLAQLEGLALRQSTQGGQ